VAGQWSLTEKVCVIKGVNVFSAPHSKRGLFCNIGRKWKLQIDIEPYKILHVSYLEDLILKSP